MVQPVGNCHYRGVMKGLMECYYKYNIRITDITNVPRSVATLLSRPPIPAALALSSGFRFVAGS